MKMRSDLAERATSPRRILFIEGNVDGTVGGSHGVLLEVVKHLDRTRFEPVVLFYQDNVLVPEFRPHAQVMVFGPGGVLFADRFPGLFQRTGHLKWIWSLLFLLQKGYNFIRYACPWHVRIVWTMLRERIDLVCLNNAPFHPDWLMACGLLGRPCVSYFRGTPYIPANRSRAFPRYDAVLSISNAVTENARKQGGEVGNFVLVYDGVDAAAVRSRVTRTREETRHEFLTGASRPLIGVVNNIKEWKGQHVAVEAVAALKQRGVDVLCLLVGDVSEVDRSYHDRVMELIRQHRLEQNVILTGRRSDVPDILNALDLVMHTSTSNEGFPRIILETLVLGRPLIASSAGPNVEMVEEEVSGFLVPPDDSAALADCIERVLQRPEQMQQVGGRAAERAQRLFSIESNMKITEDLFEQVLARKRR
jgi:glycosyltransferase involved in cell wall biosynthesis